MEIILFTLNAVLPLFLVIGVGYYLKSLDMLSEEVAVSINKVCTNVLIPCNLFKTIYDSVLEASYIKISVYTIACYVLVTPLLCWFVPKYIKSRPRAGSVIIGSFRSNMVLLGIPLMINLFGEQNIGPMAVLITALTPAYNILGVVILMLFSSENDGNTRIPFGKLLKNIAKNPLIIAGVIGAVLNLLHIGIPSLIYKPVKDLSTIASPLAMLALGARFNLKSFSENRGAIALATVLRLIVLPALIVGGGVAFGFRGPELCALFICAATPSAVATVALADAYGCDSKLSGEILISTSALSSVTLFAELCLMQFLGLM